MKKREVLSILILTFWGISISSCGTDDSETKPLTSLTSANLTTDGYFDGLLYFKITSNSPLEVGVSKANKNAQNVKIPSSVVIEGVTYKCTSIFSRAFESCNDLVTLSMADDIVSIGNDAFAGCSKLLTISLSNNITSIPKYAFLGCKSLSSLLIPPQVNSIELGAFKECTSLASVSLSSNLNRIGDIAFEGCTSLTTLEIPSYWVIVGNRAFKNCISLKTVNITNNAVGIGVESFYGCRSLKTIRLDISFIGEKSFLKCNNIESIYIKKSAPHIFSYLSLRTEAGDIFVLGEEDYSRKSSETSSNGVLTLGREPNSITYFYNDVTYNYSNIVDDDMYEIITLHVSNNFRPMSEWSKFKNIVVE